ncbi:MAG: NusG domain II-containing protein [Firmicutes bacterium]|nr:NusG domain II-containing protein [Bacillota bacterium]
MERKYTDRKDLFLIISLLITAGLLYLLLSGKPSSSVCEICLDGEVIQTVSLTEDTTFSPEGIPEITLEIRNGKIRFLSSDCPDQICVKSGFISRPGEYAVCLPHRLMIRIPEDPSSTDSRPDAITGKVTPNVHICGRIFP